MSKMGIIFSPVVSEKSFRMAASRQYTFRVDPRATGPAIGAAISHLYGVAVIAIRTANRLGKLTRHKGRSGRRKNEKRAMVTLRVGDRIAGFEVETPKPEKTEKSIKAKAIQRQSDTATPLRSAKSGASEGQATVSTKSGVTTTVRTGKKESQ